MLRLAAAAKRDLIELWEYIASDSPMNADRFLDRIYETFESLAASPDIGRSRDILAPGLRSFPVGRYVIFYRAQEEVLEVVRVVSGYRDLDQLLDQ